ncbi:MAG TPA: GDSL-type esterase/lipase family protein [Anaeromyxobacteraceae bacterium]|nr:GDSL-type esterase/lipase family protein [Anaeromyxobacteraceae bacterium]
MAAGDAASPGKGIGRATAASAAVLLLLLGALRLAALRPEPPPRAGRPATRGPAARWGGPLAPAPLVSRGKPVFSSPPGGAVLVDGVYRAGTWDGGFPTPDRPAWAAIRIGAGYTRLLVSWTSSHNHDWDERFYGAPADYRIETSADSTDGADGRWRVAVSVEDNPVRTRAHAIDFAGQRWVRLSVTRLPPKVNPWGLHLDEIDVHDLSGGGDDVWVFLGDSITAGVLDRAPNHQPSFAEIVARRHPGYFPAMIEAGKGAMHASEAVAFTDRVLELVPDARVIAIGIGSNDWDPDAFRRDLSAIVSKVRAAGKIPVVARIPYRSDSGAVDFQARLGAVVDDLTRELDLLPGPDLYRWFKAHPERLTDHLHMDDRGSVELMELWAEAADPLYP